MCLQQLHQLLKELNEMLMWKDHDLKECKRLTLASPASDQLVAFLALTVIGAHAVDTVAPLTVWWPLTLIDIWEGKEIKTTMSECAACVEQFEILSLTCWSLFMFISDNKKPITLRC